jgi:hypothetical protein
MKSYEIRSCVADLKTLYFVVADDGFIVAETRSRDKAEKICSRYSRKYGSDV